MDEDLQIKKLDALLFLFREEEVGIPVSFIKEMMLGKGFDVSTVEITRYINQLIDDNYIMYTADEDGRRIYIIKIEGLLFDGYEQQILNRISENTRLENLETGQRVSRNQMNFLTGVIAAGTLVAAIYYSIEVYKEFHLFFHHHGRYWIWETIPKKSLILSQRIHSSQ
ncbi:MAG: hypothetical protein M3O71_14580 [Bacteroidota bacterium]|nr:hypothetical protein [Bacteroidota bacterium]